MSVVVKKHITFPKALFTLLELQASKFGMTVAEYIRYLAVNDTKNLVSYTENLKDGKIIEDIGQSLQDYEQGEFTVLDSEADIRQFVDAL